MIIFNMSKTKISAYLKWSPLLAFHRVSICSPLRKNLLFNVANKCDVLDWIGCKLAFL